MLSALRMSLEFVAIGSLNYASFDLSLIHISDQISDAILDEFLRRDPLSKVACETLCTTGLVVVAGEVRSEAVSYTHLDVYKRTSRM